MTRDVEIVRALRIERRARKMSIDALASRVGVAISTVCKWELGEASPTAFHLQCWCEALGFRLAIEPAVELTAYRG